jgi:hypothetical protein
MALSLWTARASGGAPPWQAVEPRDWLGQRWPLLDSIDIRKDLSTGSWTVVLYRRDCSSCQKELPAIEAEARNAATSRPTRHFALIELPLENPNAPDIVPADTACRRGVLDPSRKWFITTPTTLTIDDGVVRTVSPE